MEHKIKTFEDACLEIGENPETIKVFDSMPERHRKHFAAHFRMETIIEAINKVENWKADMTDSKQWKYFPWMWFKKSDKNGSGFGFSRTDCVGAHTVARLGSRFALPSVELAYYVMEQFEEDCIECTLKIR